MTEAVPLLDRLLTALDLRVEIFARCEVSRGWRLSLQPSDAAYVHYVLAGSGFLFLPDGHAVPVSQHAVIIVPPRHMHGIEAPPGPAKEVLGHLPPRTEGVPLCRAGDGEIAMITACGMLWATWGGALGLFDRLKEPIVESFDGPDDLSAMFQTLLAELGAPKVGTRALTEALLKQSLVLLLRRQLERDGPTLPWLAALHDPRLAQVAMMMLERPTEPHTLASLAAIAGMSRSTFAERFTAAFGRAPMQFLKEARLQCAARLLESTNLPVEMIAQRVGYGSRSYLSRAFRAAYGVGPRTFRMHREELHRARHEEPGSGE